MDYNGQRTKDYMVNWLKKRVTDPITILDKEGYEKLQSEDKVSIVFHGDVKS